MNQTPCTCSHHADLHSSDSLGCSVCGCGWWALIERTEWGYANNGLTNKSHAFKPDQTKSACGKYERQTVLVFSAGRPKRITEARCKTCWERTS